MERNKPQKSMNSGSIEVAGLPRLGYVRTQTKKRQRKSIVIKIDFATLSIKCEE